MLVIFLSIPLTMIVVFFSVFTFTYVKQLKAGKRIIKFNGKSDKKGKLRRLLIDFPIRLVLDIFNRDPNDFDFYGLHMFCGMQGAGKTIAIVQFLRRLRKMYPELMINTNMAYDDQQNKITHWKQLVERNNGTKGAVECIDEIQAWFSSNQSKDFPVEMLAEVSQQRKQRKMLIGSAQVFGRIGKPIREQTTYVYLPYTILGCLTIVRRTRPELYNEETQTFKKFDKTYFFIHDDDIRNAFDTRERIKSYANKGFKSDEVRASLAK